MNKIKKFKVTISNVSVILYMRHANLKAPLICRNVEMPFQLHKVHANF